MWQVMGSEPAVLFGAESSFHPERTREIVDVSDLRDLRVKGERAALLRLGCYWATVQVYVPKFPKVEPDLRVHTEVNVLNSGVIILSYFVPLSTRNNKCRNTNAGVRGRPESSGAVTHNSSLVRCLDMRGEM